MKNKKKQRPTPEMITPERFDMIGDMEAVSSTDQTGLISSAPQTEAEYESYNEIMRFKPEYGE